MRPHAVRQITIEQLAVSECLQHHALMFANYTLLLDDAAYRDYVVMLDRTRRTAAIPGRPS